MGSRVPLGSALLGTVLAVLALAGTAVFGASLSHLTATPRLYGDTFQLNFTDPADGKPDPVLLRSLEQNKAVTGITEGIATEILVNKVVVGAIAGTSARGRLLLSTVTGHLPITNHQIGLGATTMRQVGAHVGSLVHVAMSLPSGRKRTGTFHVVSQVSFPVLGGAVSLGNGAVITQAGYENTLCPARSRPGGVPEGGPDDQQRRRDARACGARPAGEGSGLPLSRRLPIDDGAGHHPDLSRQFR